MALWRDGAGVIALVSCAWAAACGGRTLTAAPGADGAGGEATGAGGANGAGGADVVSAASGTGGDGSATAVSSGITSGGGSGEGGNPPNPADCIACVAQECPDAVACFTDQACIQGVVCSFAQCLQGGQPDLMCVVDCFEGDFMKALEAVQAITCVLDSCPDECGDLLPFPGP